MAFVTLHGVQYHYLRMGVGEPLVLLHGFTGCTMNWAAQIEVLSQNFDVIAVDLLGHGKTESPQDPARYAMDAAAQDLIALLDHLGLSQVHLLGYSMGGRLALYLAVHYAERIASLILESASPGLMTDAERQARVASDAALAAFIETEGIAAFVSRWEALPLFETQK